MRRILSAALALALTLCLILSLYGCGSKGSNSFTWRVSKLPTNLDPQVVTESADITACLNLYSGLFRLNETGDPQNECCESYTVSPNGLTYTFTLKKGLTYSGYRGAKTGTPVTAHDFAYGLYRVFLPETGSPSRNLLNHISGSDAVYQGGGQSALGVVALDDSTLQITLTEADPNFLQKLCLPAAMPCNQEFFESSAGAYGLTSKLVLSNGSFYLYNWTENGLFLRRSAGGSQVDALRIVLDMEDTETQAADPISLLNSEKSDAVIYTGDDETDYSELPYTTTTWALLLKCSGSLSKTAIRQAIAQSAYACSLPLPDKYPAAQGIIPPQVSLGDERYRSLTGSALPIKQDASALLRTGMEELNTKALRDISILVPEDAELSGLFDYINQRWQSQLGLYCNVVRLPLDELKYRVESGNYSIALYPVEASENTPLSVLRQFADGALCGWENPDYTAGVQSFSTGPLLQSDLPVLYGLERKLLSEGVVIPLFCESSRLLLADGISGLVFDPFAKTLDLTHTTKS